MRALPVLTALLLGAPAVAGCSSDGGDPGAAGASPTATPSPTPTAPSLVSAPPSTPGVPQATTKGAPTGTSQAARYCESLLTKDDVSALAGTDMGRVAIQPVGSTPGCRWVALDGGPITVEVVNASSSTWAQQIQQVAASVAGGGATLTPELVDQLAEARRYVKRGQEVDADLACLVFSELATLTGSSDGADATVRVTPSDQGADTVTTQVCNSDEYSFLQLADPGIAADLDTRVDAVKAALQQVQGAPLTF